MNDRQTAAEARGKHVARLLDTVLLPEFPPGVGIVLLALDIESGEAASMASNMMPHAVVEVCEQTADFLVERLGEEADPTDVERHGQCEFSVGDLVEACQDCGHALRSGAVLYARAVVICADPLMLVSETADMLWTETLHGMHLKYAGATDPWTLKKCLTRLPKKPK